MLANIWKKISNTKSLMAITSQIIIVLNVLGLRVDDAKINAGVLALCTIGVIIGVLNDKGMESEKWNK